MGESREREVRELIARGEKIQAIKCYREATGVGLALAKSAVEHFERTGSFDEFAFFRNNVPSDSPQCVEEVTRLMRLSQKIEAVKYYREQAGCGLKDAKDAVERIAQEHGIEDPRGCLGVVLLMFVAAACCFALELQTPFQHAVRVGRPLGHGRL